MAKDKQATRVAIILILLNQVSLFFFNTKKSIKRLNNNAIQIIISLKNINKSKKCSQAKKNGIIGKIVFFFLFETICSHCIPEINDEIIAP